MEFIGRIIQKLEPQSGVSKAGIDWRKQEIVLEQDTGNPMYPRKVCITFFGERADMLATSEEGMQVRVQADVESREYNGRWYTNVNGFRIEPADTPQVVPNGNAGVAMSDISTPSMGPDLPTVDTIPASSEFVTNEGDDLPF